MDIKDLPHWKRLARKPIYKSRFLNVYEDTVQLPTGDVFDDYSVAHFPDGVVIVATDTEGKLITQYEYKYAIDKVILNLPSGGMEPGVSPIEMASRELREETGYESDDLELIQSLYEYPSKQDHVLHIVRARNAKKVHEVSHEISETISDVKLMTPDMMGGENIFDTTYTVAAIAITLPEYLQTH